jgi:hypothetical protein
VSKHHFPYNPCTAQAETWIGGEVSLRSDSQFAHPHKLKLYQDAAQQKKNLSQFAHPHKLKPLCHYATSPSPLPALAIRTPAQIETMLLRREQCYFTLAIRTPAQVETVS